MATPRNAVPAQRRRAIVELLAFGVLAGVGVVALELAEYRFLVVARSLGIYVAVVSALFAGIGLWLGRTLSRRKAAAAAGGGAQASAATEAPPGFGADEARRSELEITPREREILGLIAMGLSNREIGDRLFVTESTVKSHCTRLFDKLGAKRRTQAIQIARAAGLIP